MSYHIDMPRQKKVPKVFKIMEVWEELFILLEMTDKDLKKTVFKGNKRSGIKTRKALKYAKEMITNIANASLVEEKKRIANKPKHGNEQGAGLQAMHKARNIKVNY